MRAYMNSEDDMIKKSFDASIYECGNCDEHRCYECYILSGDEERDRIEYGYMTGC
jgi:hypothetical protein